MKAENRIGRVRIDPRRGAREVQEGDPAVDRGLEAERRSEDVAVAEAPLRDERGEHLAGRFAREVLVSDEPTDEERVVQARVEADPRFVARRELTTSQGRCISRRVDVREAEFE